MVDLKKKSKRHSASSDFAKTKGKVGKAKAGAVNATNTSFQARRLALKEQQLSTGQKVDTFAKASSIDSNSLLALLQPHLSHCAHYNVNSRKEAFLGILAKCKDDAQRKQVGSVVGLLMEALGKGMIDGEGAVRSAVLSLFTFLLGKESSGMAPFVGGWISFMLLAFSHINEGVRRDGVKFLDVAIKQIPRLVAPWTGKIFKAALSAKRKTGGTKEEVVFNALIDLFIEQKIRPTTASCVAYEWRDKQTLSLAYIRLRKAYASGDVALEDLEKEEINLIVKWMSEMMMDAYAEVVPRLKNSNLPATASPSERASMATLREQTMRLTRFYHSVGLDRESMLCLLPKSLHSLIL